jgi:hypothetical protein
MLKAKFTIDSLKGIFEGHTRGENWNGWACPYFTYEQALLVLTACQQADQHGFYDVTNDRFTFSFKDEDESCEAEEIDGMKVYPIGARNWIWEEVEETAAA